MCISFLFIHISVLCEYLQLVLLTQRNNFQIIKWNNRRKENQLSYTNDSLWMVFCVVIKCRCMLKISNMKRYELAEAVKRDIFLSVFWKIKELTKGKQHWMKRSNLKGSTLLWCLVWDNKTNISHEKVAKHHRYYHSQTLNYLINPSPVEQSFLLYSLESNKLNYLINTTERVRKRERDIRREMRLWLLWIKYKEIQAERGSLQQNRRETQKTIYRQFAQLRAIDEAPSWYKAA